MHLGFDDWRDLYQTDSSARIRRYLRDLDAGRVTFMNLGLNQRLYRSFTNRTVFKIIHAAEDHVEWMVEELNAEVIILLRHPIAVSLSRKQLPRLPAFIESDYRRFFTEAQIALARRILESGSHIEKGVLSWCFQASVPLRSVREGVHVLTYEQLVCEPEVVIPWIAKWIGASDPKRMEARVARPSGTATQSFSNSSDLILESRRCELIGRWMDSVGLEERERAMGILEVFDIDAYRAAEPTASRFWLPDRSSVR